MDIQVHKPWTQVHSQKGFTVWTSQYYGEVKASTTVRDPEQTQNTKYSVNEKYQRVHQDPGRINYNVSRP